MHDATRSPRPTRAPGPSRDPLDRFAERSRPAAFLAELATRDLHDWTPAEVDHAALGHGFELTSWGPAEVDASQYVACVALAMYAVHADTNAER